MTPNRLHVFLTREGLQWCIGCLFVQSAEGLDSISIGCAECAECAGCAGAASRQGELEKQREARNVGLALAVGATQRLWTPIATLVNLVCGRLQAMEKTRSLLEGLGLDSSSPWRAPRRHLRRTGHLAFAEVIASGFWRAWRPWDFR
ncbi:unnamed protein product [Effrenium voratum]|uniref:Uncharacterized protein n=1 Tax=Effrenium voratum TaxID=2562239 RepID=A0AA36ML87_9DINO|nr:unnamed protein product [Effrenium voratum]